MTREDKFWSRVNIRQKSECWEWKAYKMKKGYGVVWFRGKYWYTHRLAYFLHTQKNIRNHICHSCDNPACCNPNHLWEGTHQQNMQDRNKKGRCSKPIGEKSWNALFTSKEVLAMRKLRKDGLSYREIMNRFEIKHGTLKAILLRKSWAHLPI